MRQLPCIIAPLLNITLCVYVRGFRWTEYDELKAASEEFSKAKFERDVALIKLEKSAITTTEAARAIGVLKDEKNRAQKANEKQRIQREIVAKRKERDEAIAEQEMHCIELQAARQAFDTAETRYHLAKRAFRKPIRARRAGDVSDSD